MKDVRVDDRFTFYWIPVLDIWSQSFVSKFCIFQQNHLQEILNEVLLKKKGRKAEVHWRYLSFPLKAWDGIWIFLAMNITGAAEQNEDEQNEGTKTQQKFKHKS